MQRKELFVLAAITVAAVRLAPAAHAQTKLIAASPAAGHILTLQVCTGCHIVAPDQPFKPVFTGPPQPPDFKDIANGRSVTAATLKRHLASLPAVPRRPSMANPELTPGQLRGVTAFILSLRDKPAAPAQ